MAVFSAGSFVYVFNCFNLGDGYNILNEIMINNIV